MITAIFDSMGQAVTGFNSTLASAFTSVGSMFYDKTNGMTLLGTLLCVAAGVGVVYFAFRMIKGLVKRA